MVSLYECFRGVFQLIGIGVGESDYTKPHCVSLQNENHIHYNYFYDIISIIVSDDHKNSLFLQSSV